MKYETPEMEIMYFDKDIRTNDIIINSVAGKTDNNVGFEGPF